jgi:hypothetical protein
MFDSAPHQSTIVLEDICSICKKDVIIQITPTSGGFGLLGGMLFEKGTGGYYAECVVCYNTNRGHK